MFVRKVVSWNVESCWFAHINAHVEAVLRSEIYRTIAPNFGGGMLYAIRDGVTDYV